MSLSFMTPVARSMMHKRVDERKNKFIHMAPTSLTRRAGGSMFDDVSRRELTNRFITARVLLQTKSEIGCRQSAV